MRIMSRSIAYLRKSRVTNDRHVSWEVQLQSVNELAARMGDPEPAVLSDWNVSGRKGADKRPGYAALLAAIEGRQVDVVYSYSLSRLARSLVEYSRLAELCTQIGVTIRLVKEGEIKYDTPAGRLHVGILALFAQMEAEIAQERAKDTIAVRRARGDQIGARLYGQGVGESVERVTGAYREAGSWQGAAHLLNAAGVAPKRGGRWFPTTVRQIVMRNAPELVPARPRKGVKPQAPFLFYRLLRCRCGAILTGTRTDRVNGPGYVRYRCVNGRSVPGHGPVSVAENTILPWLQAEAALLTPPDPVVQMAESTREQQNALRDRLARLGRAYVDGAIPEGEYEAEREALLTSLEKLDAQGRAVTLEPINWAGPPALVNQVLRAVWSRIVMGPDQRPVAVDWLHPEWRSAA